MGIAGSLIVRLALSEKLGSVPTTLAIDGDCGGLCRVRLLAFIVVVEPPARRRTRRVNLAAHLAAQPACRAESQLWIVSHRACGADAGSDWDAVLCRLRRARAGANAEMVSVYLAFYTAAFLLSNVVWSRLSDRRAIAWCSGWARAWAWVWRC